MVGDEVAIDARTRTPLELQIPADGRAPGRIRGELTRWLAARSWPDEDGDDLVLAVSEAVSNASEHAYRGGASAEKPKPLVAVLVTELTDADRRRAEAVIDDFGVWRPAPPSPGTRGRGLRMIGMLVESYSVVHGGAGTRVTMMSRPVEFAARATPAGSEPENG
jgi:anti-sigma regulatory factor (Ser/Thr protein kinase)